MNYLIGALLTSLISVSYAQEADVKSKSLQQIYALSQEKVEEIVSTNYQSFCDGLVSVYIQGHTDPANLTPAEFCAVQHYSGAGFKVNTNLWLTDSTGSGLDGLQWAYVRVLDSALRKIKNEKPSIVYRGASKKHIVLPKPGGTIRLKGYTSTSLDRDVAEGFIEDRLMIIKVFSSKNIKLYSNAGTEDEYLLPRDTYLRLDRSEFKTLSIFTDFGPEDRKVEIVYLTEITKAK